ncbi:hypothetical protein GCM10018966_097920 [Streptomyces yanii]
MPGCNAHHSLKVDASSTVKPGSTAAVTTTYINDGSPVVFSDASGPIDSSASMGHRYPRSRSWCRIGRHIRGSMRARHCGECAPGVAPGRLEPPQPCQHLRGHAALSMHECHLFVATKNVLDRIRKVLTVDQTL